MSGLPGRRFADPRVELEQKLVQELQQLPEIARSGRLSDFIQRYGRPMLFGPLQTYAEMVMGEVDLLPAPVTAQWWVGT